MYSKSLLVAALIALSGCGWIQDKPKPQQTIQSSVLDLSCLNDVPTQLQTLFQGGYGFDEPDQRQLDSLWQCLDKTLDTFSRYTTGAKPGVYTSKELRGFANRYLPSTRSLGSGMTDSIFKLKRAVLGGNDTEITQPEIQSLRAKLTKFAAIIKPFSGYLDVLIHPEGKTALQKRIASENLNQFVLDLADLLGDSVNPVAWSDLISFIDELDLFTRAGGSPTALTAVKEQLPLFQYFKLLIVGGNENAIERAKWRPIFQAVSHFYNALFLTNNLPDLLEALSIEVDSTEIEQKEAVERITGLLKVLKNDPTLYSKNPIATLSDSWAKVLMLNSFLFPRSQGSLALKAFLSSTAIRKLAGYIVNQTLQIDVNQLDPNLIQSLADNVISLVEQAAIANSPGVGVSSPFSFSTFRDYLPQIKPLLKDPRVYDMAEQGAETLRLVTPLLIGKESDALTPRDLRAIIEKGIDLFLTWNDSKNIEESIGQSLDILLRRPNFYSLQSVELEQALNSMQSLLNLANLTNHIPWDAIRTHLHRAMKAKAVLFGNSNQTLSNYELQQLANLWEPFRKGVDPDHNLGQVLENLANLLKNSPFASAKIEDLVSVADLYLPADRSVESWGFSFEQLGQIKALVIGGATDSISPDEYTDLAHFSSVLAKEVYPQLQSLPKGFKPGLNSQTFTILESGLQSLIDSRANTLNDTIPLQVLKDFIASYLKTSGYSVHEKTISTFLIGVNHRLFQGQKTDKPKTLKGGIKVDELVPLVALASRLKTTFADFEQAFGDVPETQSVEKAELLSRLTLDEDKEVLEKLPPIMKGGTGLPYFNTPGKANHAYYLNDLAYKGFLYHVLNWVFKGYQVHPDPDSALMLSGLSPVRLNYDDVVDVLTDINDLISELKLSYSTDAPRVSARKRMQTINIFTQSGNGDDYIDLYETMEFLTLASSGRTLLDSTLASLMKTCAPEARTIDDVKGFPVACLRSTFFQPAFFSNVYGPVAPQMTAEYLSLSEDQKTAFQNAVFSATATGWNEHTLMTPSDMETFVSVPYYAENIFERLDHNFDSTINFSEAMSGFPVFCNEIKKAGNGALKGSCTPGEYAGQVEAIYGYLLFYGRPPNTPQPGDGLWRKIKKTKALLSWLRYWKRLNRDSDVRDSHPPQLKRHDLLTIISNLSSTLSGNTP